MTKTASLALGNKRLLMLADRLNIVDAIHRKKGEPTYDQSSLVHACGSPACAAGHYLNMPHVKRRDLVWTVPSFEREFCLDTRTPPYGVSTDFGKLFGQTGCDGAKTAKQAAKYIRQFVKARQATK